MDGGLFEIYRAFDVIVFPSFTEITGGETAAAKPRGREGMFYGRAGT